ncbi:MAG: hypothetical protein WCI84_00290 [Bacteroidota bacterium]
MTEYLLKKREEDDKSKFLAGAGYSLESADILATDIRQQTEKFEAVLYDKTEYVVTIVEFHAGASTHEQGYTVEVFNATGDTIAVVTLPASHLEPLLNTEILHVRHFQQVAEPPTQYPSAQK